MYFKIPMGVQLPLFWRANKLTDELCRVRTPDGYHRINVVDIVVGELLNEDIPQGGVALYRLVNRSDKTLEYPSVMSNLFLY